MSAPALPHTRALLSYLFATYSKPNAQLGSSSSPPQANATSTASSSQPSSPEISLSSLSIAGSSSGGSRNGESEDEGGSASARGAQSAAHSTHSDNKQKIDAVVGLLSDDSIDEDDMPERIQEELESKLTAVPNLDGMILSLLHRHREDLNPSGNPVPPLPNHGSSTPTRPSVSRASSIRRGPAAATARGGSNLRSDSSSAQPSDISSASSSNLSPRSAHATPNQSPWSSPRPAAMTLSAGAAEFKFSAGASDFVPGASSLHAPGTASPSLLGSRPSTPLRSRSPHPVMNPLQAQANWAFTSSPLGTPKYGIPPGLSSNGANSPAPSSPSYFPRSLGAGVAERLQQQQHQTRLPWAEAESGEDGDHSNSFGNDDDEEDNPEPTDYKPKRKAHQPGTESPMWPQGDPGIYQAHHQPSFPHSGAFTPNGGEWAEPSQTGMVYQGGYAGGGWQQQPPHEYAESYTPTFEGAGGMLLGGPGPGESVSIEFANSLSGPSGLGGMGAYSMTPFDVLHSIFAGSNIDAGVLEEALAMTGFDVDEAMNYIIETSAPGAEGAFGPDGEPLLTPTGAPPTSNRSMLMSSGSRPMVVSRDSFDGFGGGNGGRGSPGPGGRWGGAPQGGPDQGRGVGGRVCRYYLSGNCLRSDCKFSHDVGKAVCKFWLRGHCLKGDGRCDFLHSIPPIMRADFEQRARRRAQPPPMVEPEPDAGPDLDFPSLGDAPRSRRNQIVGRATTLDPTRSRFANALKMGAPSAPGPPQQPSLPMRAPAPPIPTRDQMPQPRPSGRIALRPPVLFPTVTSGPELAKLYIAYRQCFLELGANRNKCLARAAECWKRGDGAGAKRFSSEAQNWNRQVAIEGRDSANRIVQERQRLLQHALGDSSSASADDGPSRKVRGQLRGYGVCLGVASAAVLGQGGNMLNSDERTEVGLDLHALHTDEAVAFMGEFLGRLEVERFAGLAFVLIGQSKHSGNSAPDAREAAGRLRLEQACTEFLSDSGYPWRAFQGTLAIDVLRT